MSEGVLGLFARLSPNDAVLLLTAGLLLIYFELNRPGTVLAGAVGLLATLIALAVFSLHRLNPAAVVLLLSAIVLLLLDLLRQTPVFVAVAANVALILGMRCLFVHDRSSYVSTPVAVGCGLILGAGTSLLTRIARRARTNKGLD